MPRKSNTGNPTEYDAVDVSRLFDALDSAFQRGSGTNMRVTAKIEWGGVVDRARDGKRTTKLDGLNLTRVKDAVDKARTARDKAESARPAESYDAKGWHAQLRALTGTPRGSELADRVGLSPTARTLVGWLSESTEPSKANQAKIAEAYAGLRTWGVDHAKSAAEQANREVAEKLSEAIRERYGAEVRLRDIEGLDLS